MNRQLFATHLGFYTWEQLLAASELVSSEPNGTQWYVAYTSNWYKWVLWNTNFDVYFNHETQEDALKTLKYVYEKKHVTDFRWVAPIKFGALEACMAGMQDDALIWLTSDS